MKYALLIYGNDTEWESRSEEEKQAIYGEYIAGLGEPRRLRRLGAAAGRHGDDRALAERRDADDGRAVHRGEGSRSAASSCWTPRTSTTRSRSPRASRPHARARVEVRPIVERA